jgi:hypothetical protein
MLPDLFWVALTQATPELTLNMTPYTPLMRHTSGFL